MKELIMRYIILTILLVFVGYMSAGCLSREPTVYTAQYYTDEEIEKMRCSETVTVTAPDGDEITTEKPYNHGVYVQDRIYPGEIPRQTLEYPPRERPLYKPKVEWLGHIVFAKWYQAPELKNKFGIQEWSCWYQDLDDTVEIGLRNDGVVVWRKVEKIK